ncbi:hypothetical protein AC623_09080 [Bacillus sp. FJAT-27231]|nr:hypothetical protein AC623_09080 [Bacillus sp. FJAT-27231]
MSLKEKNLITAFYTSQPAPTIQFSGYEWEVKQGEKVGPGPNNWLGTNESVWVDDQGKLHLRIIHRNGKWYAAEVINKETLGYGTYRFYLEARTDLLDPNAVIGLFTYDSISRDAAENDFREIDIEFSRWGQSGNANVGQYMVQPNNNYTFKKSLTGDWTTHAFEWTPEKIFFYSHHGHSETSPNANYIINQWTYEGENIPNSKNEKVSINFWLNKGEAPLYGKEIEIVISKFEFIPN